MKKIRAIIVDDENLARDRIASLLKGEPDFEVIGQFKNGHEALVFVNKADVDLIYLDIHMPIIDGFSFLSKLPKDRKPFVVFATADVNHALRAFEYHAIDYLLKPFRDERFCESLENVKTFFGARNQQLSSRSSIVIKLDNSEVELATASINYIQSDGNYIRLYTDEKHHLTRKTLQELGAELDPIQFIRIQRSTIVNRSFIKAVRYVGNNEYRICLMNDSVLKSGRYYKDQIATLTIHL